MLEPEVGFIGDKIEIASGVAVAEKIKKATLEKYEKCSIADVICRGGDKAAHIQIYSSHDIKNICEEIKDYITSCVNEPDFLAKELQGLSSQLQRPSTSSFLASQSVAFSGAGADQHRAASLQGSCAARDTESKLEAFLREYSPGGERIRKMKELNLDTSKPTREGWPRLMSDIKSPELGQMGDIATVAMDTFVRINEKAEQRQACYAPLFGVDQRSNLQKYAAVPTKQIRIPIKTPDGITNVPLGDLLENLREFFPNWEGLGNMSSPVDESVKTTRSCAIIPKRGDFELEISVQAYTWAGEDKSKEVGEGRVVQILCSPTEGSAIFHNETRKLKPLYLPSRDGKNLVGLELLAQNLSDERLPSGSVNAGDDHVFIVTIPIAHPDPEKLKEIAYRDAGSSESASSPLFRQTMTASRTPIAPMTSQGRGRPQRASELPILLERIDILREGSEYVDDKLRGIAELSLTDIATVFDADLALIVGPTGQPLQDRLRLFKGISPEQKGELDNFIDPFTQQFTHCPVLVHGKHRFEAAQLAEFLRFQTKQGKSHFNPLTRELIKPSDIRFDREGFEICQKLQQDTGSKEFYSPENPISPDFLRAYVAKQVGDQADAERKYQFLAICVLYYGFEKQTNSSNADDFPFAHKDVDKRYSKSIGFGYNNINNQTLSQLEQEIRDDLTLYGVDVTVLPPIHTTVGLQPEPQTVTLGGP